MKKILKALFAATMLMPIILLAQEEEEVKYRFYYEIESNVRYVKNPEQICEYYDKNNYIYEGYNYSFEPVEEKENRKIDILNYFVNVDSEFVNQLEFNNVFTKELKDVKAYDLKIYYDNQEIPYSFERREYIDNINNLSDNDMSTFAILKPNSVFTVTFNTYYSIAKLKVIITYQTGNNYIDIIPIYGMQNYFKTQYYNNPKLSVYTDVYQDYVTMEERFNMDYIDNNSMILTKIYHYQDPLYKCYNKQRIYLPDYYTSVDGFIKDENDFIIVQKDNTIDNLNKELNEKILENYNLNNMLDNLRVEYDNLSNEYNRGLIDKQNEIDNITRDLNNLMNEYNSALIDKQSEIDNLTRDLNNLMNEYNNELMNKQNEIDNLKMEYDYLLDEYNIALIDKQSEINNLNNVIISLKVTIDSLEEINLSLNELINSKDLELYRYKSNLIKKENEINSYNNKLYQLENSNKSLDSIISTLVNKIDDNNYYINEVKLQIDRLNNNKKDEINDGLIAYKTNEVSKITYNDISLYLCVFGVLSLLLSLIIIIRNKSKKK